MVDEFKSIKDTLLKSVISAVAGDGENGSKSTFALREIISALATLAGKGKDEIVQLISREIGSALAAALKEPLQDALKDKKLKMTIEFVPHEDKKSHKQPTSHHRTHKK